MTTIRKTFARDFPDGLVGKAQCCHRGDTGSIPGRGTKIPRAILHSQKKKKNQKTYMYRLGLYTYIYIYFFFLAKEMFPKQEVTNMLGERESKIVYKILSIFI